MRISIFGGAGGVGASAALNLLRGPGAHEVIIIDQRPEFVTSHVMDLEQVCAFSPDHTVREGDLSDVASSDIVVVTAGAPLRVNVSRHVFTEENAQIVGTVLDALPPGWPGILLIVTNPVDPLVTWINTASELKRHQVLGYTLNDNLRLRCGIAERLGIHPATVDAWAIGEHGDAIAPLWDRVRVDGLLVELSAAQRDGAVDFVRNWYRRHVALDSGRSSTWTSGVGVAQMISAIANDSQEPWPASVMLAGEYGYDRLALSVPVLLGRNGLREVLEWDLEPSVREGLAEAAEVVAASVSELDPGARAST